MTSVLEDLAAAAVLAGDPARAAGFLGAAERARARIGTPIATCEQPDHAATLAAVEAALADEDFEQAFEDGKIAHEPLDEAAHRELMKCWARLGEPARAIRHYQRLQDLLRKELGAPPAAGTARLYEKLRAGA